MQIRALVGHNLLTKSYEVRVFGEFYWKNINNKTLKDLLCYMLEGQDVSKHDDENMCEDEYYTF